MQPSASCDVTTLAVPRSLLPSWLRILRGSAVALVIGAALWFSRQSSYLLFHSLVEVFSVVVGGAIFMISWSSREQAEARPFLVLGIGYLFVAILDTFHLLSYEGMTALANSQDNATRLWIAARALQAASTLVFLLPWRSRRGASIGIVFLIFGGAALVAMLSITPGTCFRGAWWRAWASHHSRRQANT